MTDKKNSTRDLVAEVNRRDDLAMDNAPHAHPMRRKTDASPPLTLEDLKNLRFATRTNRGFYGEESVEVTLWLGDVRLAEFSIDTKKEDSPY